MSASFEHSAMKSSFSLSSLRSAPAPPARCDHLERPYHSLTKKRKEPCREAWRRSWGSAASGSAGDDLWPLLQHHYDYIMDNHLIDTCKEANGELLSSKPAALLPRLNPTAGFNRQWSLSQLVAEFGELCQWLSQVQEEIYSSPENLSSRKLRTSRMAELASVEPRRAKFIEQASAILERIPEASAEVSWRVDHLNAKWEGVRLLLSPEQPQRDGEGTDTVDTSHELRCLRRWLHGMEGRLPPPSLAAARASPYHELLRKLREHEVLQRDVECHGRIVSSVVRLCAGGDAARALERRWHLLYLRAIEWQCHLEACLARIDNQGCASAEAASDSDEEPALKQPRLGRRGSPRRLRTERRRDSSGDSRQSASEEEQDYVVRYQWRGFGSDCESERHDMDARVPSSGEAVARDTDQTVPAMMDELDGLEHGAGGDKPRTPPTVIKRKKPADPSKFNQTNRKSDHLAIFYFKHRDTDSDRQIIETDEKSQEESSEEEWTYVNSKIANEDSTDIMTSSIEVQCELPIDQEREAPKLLATPDLLRVDNNTRCKDIERLVMQAEELVQKQAHEQMAKKKGTRSFKPLAFEEDGKHVSRAKMSWIKEWLNQSSEGNNNTHTQGTESCDASGEYTTESEVDTSLTSEERNIHSSMDMSTSTCTVTPTHHAKVQLRKKRAGNSARPWSVSCISQLSGAAASLAATPTAAAPMSHIMSISESALNTLAEPQRVTPANSNSKLRGSSTTVQGHVSSTNTMTEACTSCVEAADKQCWLRRKRLKLRRHNAARRERLVKSQSFCGLSREHEDKHERSTASDPATSKKNRFDTTSTSGNDSDDELIRQQLATIANLRKSIEKTHISSREDNAIPEQNEQEVVAPSFKIGPAGGLVRPRIAMTTDRDKTFLALSLGDPNQLWDLSMDKDSDIDKSVTAGTEGHSSFSEQAWDFYQEKYNSEPYSEAPDSDAARRLLEFGDDYRTFLDSQSDCCSSLSAQPERDSPGRRREPPRHKRPTRSPVETPSRKPKKSMSSAERKKSLLDSLERSRNNTSIESNDGVRRRKPSESDRKSNKRSPEFDLLNVQALSRRRHSSNMTSDEVNSSLEYTEVNNRPDILDSLGRRRRNLDKNVESELHKVAMSELRRRSTENVDSEDDMSSPKKHSRRNWSGDSDSESEEVRSLVRRSSAQLDAAEATMARHEASPDLLRAFDYTELETRCRDNINLLDAALAGGSLSPVLQRDIRVVSARWSALRAAASRRGGTRRLRREVAALRENLLDICEPEDCAPQPHTRVQLNRRIEELKDRLARLLDCKVSMLKIKVSVKRALGENEPDDSGLAADLAALLALWEDAHHRTSNELLTLEKAVCAWAEWESALRELQGALRGDLATLEALRDRPDQAQVTAQIRQLAASLVDKKKVCDSELQGALRGDLATLEALRDRPDQAQVTAQIRQLAASLVDKKKVCDSELQGALRGDLATLEALRDRPDQAQVTAQIRQLAASLVDKKKVCDSELQGALRGDLATLEALRDRPDQAQVTAQIRQLAASLVDKKKVCDSELQGALRGDLATLEALRDRPDQAQVTAQIRQLAASLVDKKKVCDSELQGALRGDLATLEALRDRPDQAQVTAQIRQLAASLVDKKKVCDSELQGALRGDLATLEALRDRPDQAQVTAQIRQLAASLLDKKKVCDSELQGALRGDLATLEALRDRPDQAQVTAQIRQLAASLVDKKKVCDSELQGALRGDLATLEALRDRPDQAQVTAQIRQLAASLVDKKKVCDSELQGALRGDLATLEALRDRPDQAQVTAQIRQLAASLVDKKKVCDSELQGALRGDLATLEALRDRPDQAQVTAQIRQLAASLFDKKKVCDSELQGALRGDLATLEALRDRPDQVQVTAQIRQLAASLVDKKKVCDSELQGALRGDLATLEALRDRPDQAQVTAQIRQLAASLVDKKKVCDSELQGALRGDLATLEALRDRPDQAQVTAQIRQLAASLVDKKKVCDSELQGALRGDLATLEALRDRPDQAQVTAQIRQLAASLVDKKKVCDSELQGALRGDLATLEALRDRPDQAQVTAQIRQLAASLVDKKKGGSTCDSLSDSGISDGDSEGAGGRARRLNTLRDLARRLQAALAPNSPAHRAITKRMEQTENEVRTLQESCRALVEQSIPDLNIHEETVRSVSTVLGKKTGSGDPEYTPRSGWVWRVLRSSLPIQLCLVALLLAAWLVERPRCCDALNSLAQTLTPQLRYVRGPPPV